MKNPTRLLLSLVVVLCASSCTLLSRSPAVTPADVERENVPEHLRRVQNELQKGRTLDAIDRLVALRASPQLTPEQLRETETLLDRVVRDQLGLDETGVPVADPKLDAAGLRYLYKRELPVNLRASAGLLSARALFRSGHPVAAYKRVRAVDRKLPEHGARALGGEVLAEVGLALIRTPGNYYLIFSYANRGVAALEYLVLNYPLAKECDEAYVELSQYYERTGDYDYAIERLEDLLLYHPSSPYVVSAEAHLPLLRVERMGRDDYDRSQLLQARSEIDQWLTRHPDDELRAEVEALRRRVERRLARSDLYLAGFYRKVDSALGQRLHAERALEEAGNAGAEEEMQAARELLAEVAEVDMTPETAPSPVPSAWEPVGPVGPIGSEDEPR